MTYGHVFPAMPNVPAKRQKRSKRGYDPKRRTCQATVLTDQQVLDARGRYEFQGWTPKQCAKVAGCDLDYMRAVLRYATRCKLFPRREDYPAALRNEGKPL